MNPFFAPTRFPFPSTFTLLCCAALMACGGGNDTEEAIDAHSATTAESSGAGSDAGGTDSESLPSTAQESGTTAQTSAPTTAPTGAATCGGFSPAELLAAINAARAQARQCGATSKPAVPAVAWNGALADAAHRHSTDMATRNFFSHTGSDGSNVGQRVSEAGYPWTAVAENISGGPTTSSSVVAGWLASAGHCANIMGAAYQHVGVACVAQTGSTYSRYWTMVLARP